MKQSTDQAQASPTKQFFVSGLAHDFVVVMLDLAGVNE
jgi:hypothetical protein